MKSYMIIDGQWGSTGKGLLCGYLALKHSPDTAVCNFGANAGHTFTFDDGRAVMTQALPTAIVSPSVKKVLLGPGAIVDPSILNEEMDKYSDLLKGKEIYIHPMAAVIFPCHRDKERGSLNRVSSTCKGVGAAQADKIMRVRGAVVNDCRTIFEGNIIIPTVEEFTEMLMSSETLQIESAQGMELGINSGGFYPYCTSRDVNVHQVLSDCGIPYGIRPKIFVTMRTFPIRVGDAFGIGGEKVGTSGPVYPDQKEITWEMLNVPEEKTTVTKKVRRIFTWSDSNYKKMITMLNPDSVFLNFTNYLEENSGFGSPKTGDFVDHLDLMYESMKGRGPIVRWIGVGPKDNDVIERTENGKL